MSQSRDWPGELVKVILGGGGGGGLFTLAHFKTLCSIVSELLSCLFPSIIDDTHILGPILIITSTYEHLWIKLYVICLSIQLINV